MANLDDPKEEYKDLSDNMRHYGNMRFAQLTIFVSLTSGFIILLFKDLSSFDKTFIKGSATFFTILFGIMEERAADFYHHFRKRAKELEYLLGYRQYKDLKSKNLFSATNASSLFYFAVLCFWESNFLFDRLKLSHYISLSILFLVIPLYFLFSYFIKKQLLKKFLKTLWLIKKLKKEIDKICKYLLSFVLKF
jgi:hypothetical protein